MKTLAGFALNRAFTYFHEDYSFQEFELGIVDMSDKITLNSTIKLTLKGLKDNKRDT